MTSLLQVGPSGRVSAPPEKRFLISYQSVDVRSKQKGREAAMVPDPNFSLIQLPTEFKARKHAGRASFKKPGSYELFNADGPGCIRHITVIYKPFGDHARIEIFSDDDDKPQVDMDLNAFFGVLLDVDPRTTNYRADGAGIKVLPEGGYNCYLPIPFQTSCRIVLTTRSPDPVQVYSQIDWQQYEAGSELTPYRLHAVHRKETPAGATGQMGRCVQSAAERGYRSR